MKAPTPIDLSAEAVADFKLTLHQSPIDEKTKSLLVGLIDFCLWLQFKLQDSKISIKAYKVYIYKYLSVFIDVRRSKGKTLSLR